MPADEDFAPRYKCGFGGDGLAIEWEADAVSILNDRLPGCEEGTLTSLESGIHAGMQALR